MARHPMPVESRDDLVKRLHFDATRCEMQLSKGVATNIDEAATRIASDAKRIAELEAERDALRHDIERHIQIAADQERALGECEQLLSRYLKETPLGHQPHMIAHEADAAIKAATAIRSGKTDGKE